MADVQIQKSKGSIKTLWLLIALFVAPIVIAAWQYFSETDWDSRGTRNHGELVRPAHPLSAFYLQTLSGEAFELQDLQRIWSLVMVAHKQCAADCEDALYKTRQARLAQGRETSRVQRVLVLDQVQFDGAQIDRYREQHADLIIVTGTHDQVLGLMLQFSKQHTVDQSGEVYMVDPLSNHMMNYKNGFDAGGLLKDIRRLLQVSQIG